MNKPFLMSGVMDGLDAIVDVSRVENIMAVYRVNEYGDEVQDTTFTMDSGREYFYTLSEDQYTALVEYLGIELEDN